jgi:hypothetical protein
LHYQPSSLLHIIATHYQCPRECVCDSGAARLIALARARVCNLSRCRTRNQADEDGFWSLECEVLYHARHLLLAVRTLLIPRACARALCHMHASNVETQCTHMHARGRTTRAFPLPVAFGEARSAAAAAGFFLLSFWPLLKAREPSRWCAPVMFMCRNRMQAEGERPWALGAHRVQCKGAHECAAGGSRWRISPTREASADGKRRAGRPAGAGGGAHPDEEGSRWCQTVVCGGRVATTW